MRNGQGWSVYLKSHYFCPAYRKIYSGFFCCISCQWQLIFPLSFLHCLQSSYLWAFLMFTLLLDGPVTQTPMKSIDPFEAKAAAQAGATEDCSCLVWFCGEMLLFYILFWEIVILCGFTGWRFLFVISSPTYHWEIPPENIARLLAKQEESFTKFSNTLSIWNCCHSCFHLSSEGSKLPQAR